MNSLFLKLYVKAQDLMYRQDGQSMSEYVMAVGLIALGAVAGETAIARSVNQTFIALATTITTGVFPQ